MAPRAASSSMPIASGSEGVERTTSWKAVFAAVTASFGSFLFGLDIGYIAPILECPPFKRDVAHLDNWQDPASKVDSMTAGLIVSIFSLGCIVSSFPAVSSYFLDVWGRNMSIIFGAAVFLCGCALQALAFSIKQMLIGRCVAGLSIGLLSAAIPLYQSEVAPTHLRGCLVSVYQLMITLGIFIAAYVDMILVDREDGWRLAIWLQAGPALALLIFMKALPQSPRWLVQSGQEAKAMDALVDLRGERAGRRECQEIVAEVEAERARGQPKWGALFVGRVGQLLLIGSILQLLQQLVGMNAFMYFGPRIFKDLGLSENKFQTINNGVNFLSTFAALALSDRLGRKTLMAAGAAGMSCACFFMGTLGFIFVTRDTSGGWTCSNQMAARGLAASVFFFVFCFAATWGPIVWVYCAEIFPLNVRSRCIGLTTTVNWIGNFLIAMFTPIMLEYLGFGTFLTFGACALLGLIITLRLPETKGVSLEHMEAVFDELLGEDRSGPPQTREKSYGTMLFDPSSKRAP